MKKIVFCNNTMQENVVPLVYQSYDEAMPAADIPVAFPVLSYLASSLKPDDSVKLVLICKHDPHGRWKKNEEIFQSEFKEYCSDKCANAVFSRIDIDFDEDYAATGKLLRGIVEECEEDAELICDITYGTKAIPVVLLSAMAFAMEHLNCKVRHVFYGQVFFQSNQPTEPRLCDLSYLLYFNSLMHTMKCESPDKAKQALDMLLRL